MTLKQAKAILAWHAKHSKTIWSVVHDHEFMMALRIVHRNS